MKNEKLEISSHYSCGLDVYSWCHRICFGTPILKRWGENPRLLEWSKSIWMLYSRYRVSLASSFLQPWKKTKNLGFYLVWELPTLAPGECQSQQTLESTKSCHQERSHFGTPWDPVIATLGRLVQGFIPITAWDGASRKFEQCCYLRVQNTTDTCFVF